MKRWSTLLTLVTNIIDCCHYHIIISTAMVSEVSDFFDSSHWSLRLTFSLKQMFELNFLTSLIIFSPFSYHLQTLYIMYIYIK